MSYVQSDIYTKIKNSVSSIGEWLEDRSETVTYWLGMIIAGISVLVAVIGVIFTWIQNGFGKALITAVISVVALGIFIYVLTIAASLGKFVVKILSYAFKNIYVLEIVLIVLLSLAYFGSEKWEADSSQMGWAAAKEQVQDEPAVMQYRCTASKVLNVRVAPDSDAKLVGTIKAGDIVDVYEICDGYARIIYNGQDAYASTSYLEAL